MKISQIIKKFVGKKNCIHFQYKPLSETALKWKNKIKTKYVPAKATIILPPNLCSENLFSLKNYSIFLIAIPKDKVQELIDKSEKE